MCKKQFNSFEKYQSITVQSFTLPLYKTCALNYISVDYNINGITTYEEPIIGMEVCS